MKGEIDRDFYCACDNFISETSTCCMGKPGCIRLECKYCHHKWPTPDQYEEEYGEEYPEDGAVYVLFESRLKSCWTAEMCEDANKHLADLPRFYSDIICACTPYGSPPNGWRPE
jgi:hypothetical protein